MIIRKYNLGSEWIYLKIYSGPQTLEKILCEDFFFIFHDLFKEKKITKFFFIRYADEFHHLRIRLKVGALEDTNLLINIINHRIDPYMQKRLIWNVSYSSYNREIERYGTLNMDDCETLFCYSSWQIINILKDLGNNGTEQDRWLWGCKSIDMLLNQFQLSLEQKCNFFEAAVAGYSSEYNLTKLSVRKLNDKFRELGKRIETSILEPLPAAGEMLPAIENMYIKAIGNLLRRHHSGELSPDLVSLLISLVHMHLNRLYQSRQRKTEFVICYLMSKYYKSQSARQQSIPQNG